MELLVNSKREEILDNDKLVNILIESKRISEKIIEEIKDSSVVEEQIQRNREIYKGIATRASILFFIVKDLSKIDYMYQFSL